MKNLSHAVLAGFLAVCSISAPLCAEETKTTWQKWKKPIVGTTLVVGGIAGWLLLDYYLKSQFNSKLNATTNALVNGRDRSFFETNGELRKYPNLSEEQLMNQVIVDGQLYENARFGNMVTSVSKVTKDIWGDLKCLVAYGDRITLSDLARYMRAFNMNLLAHQIASKLCFATSLIGGYLLMNSNEDTTEKSDESNTIQS